MKFILVLFLAFFFIANGVNHFLNPIILEEYMEKRHFSHTKLLVRLSGLLLLFGGIGLLIPLAIIKIISCYALAIFVLSAGLMLHSFWKETQKDYRMLELQNFIKNIVIAVEMIYLSTTF